MKTTFFQLSGLLLASVFVFGASTSFAQNNGNGNGNSNTFPNNGNVGVGTSSPNAKLHVNGKMKVDSTMTVSDTLFVESTAQVSESFRVEGATEMQDVIIYGTTWMKGLQSINENDFGVLVSKDDGTVMRATPGELFPVPNQPVGFCDLQGNPYSTNPYWVSQPNRLYTACPDVFVGIGTETPRVKLDNLGTTYSRDLALSTNPLTMGGTRLKIEGYDLQDNTNLVSISNTSNDILNLTNQGTLNLSGNMVLNSDQPSPLVISNSSGKILQLNNDGLLRARSVKLDVDVWPDYVFEDNYELLSLEEIKAFIEQNGHLPDVPSAKVVEEEGIDVGEMNKILLQKLEELTLLVIEQDEKIKKLEETISK
ncbi:MAG: hypothetical protein NXI10_05540 [bacterium]|nr:hypothetical protein [bacterium]